MIHKKVMFKGKIYWLHSSDYSEGFNISPLNHYTEDGRLLADPFDDLSFAIMNSDGKILRFGKVIGNKSDLTDMRE